MANLLRQEAETIERGTIFPWLTALFALAFVAIYAVEQHLGASAAIRPAAPATGTLLALGGLNRFLVFHGEPYRLLTAPFLHGSLKHLISNLVVFVLAGYRLEKLTGRAWLFCIFAGGALAGTAMSLALTASGVAVSVGASGGIMAMLAALFLVSFRLPPSRAKTRAQRWVMTLLVPALIPLSPGASATHVDYGAHLGGAALGALLGLLLALAWSEYDKLPPFRIAAAAMAGAACLAFTSSAYAVVAHYPTYAPLTRMIPDVQLPHGTAQVTAQAGTLLAQYPRDPRAHLIAAEARAMQHDLRGAEQELRTGLAVTDEKTSLLFPAMPAVLKAVLAQALLEEGRGPEAYENAAIACAATGNAALPPQVLKPLLDAHLCNSKS